ncbi:MAG: ComF family protein [bacterium]|nr:ComF family protein [bacterium]
MKWLDTFIHFILPNYCHICDKKLSHGDTNCFCSSCWEKLELTGKDFCRKCGKRIITPDGVCRECSNKRFDYQEIRSVGVYEGTFREAIHLYKFSSRWKMAHDFTRLILKRIEDDFLRGNDVLIPVPLARDRLMERGFHQTFFITRLLSQELGIPVLKKALIKVRNTQAQSGLKKEERLVNLKEAFRTTARSLPLIRGKRILLFDDVYTTGATVQECSRTLKEAGAGRINVLILGRGQ